jgi:hypothetical protein
MEHEGTNIKRCNNAKCINEYQDDKYGKGMRVHNRTTKKDMPKLRCTVCKEERD